MPAMQALNQAISDLQTFSGGGPNKQSADHSHTVVDSLRSRLKDATATFKEVLTQRTDSLKAHQQRKSMFSAAPEGSAAARQPLFSQPGASFLPPNARNPLSAPAVRGGLQGGSGSSEAQPLLGGSEQQQQQQQQQALMVPQQDAYLSSRAEALHQVESTIVELGSIFQQLAHMVGGRGARSGRRGVCGRGVGEVHCMQGPALAPAQVLGCHSWRPWLPAFSPCRCTSRARWRCV
jgi:syntaxin 5